MSTGLPPLPSSLNSSSLFSSCCSEQAAESEQQEPEILCLEGEIRVLFLLSKSNLFCFAGDFSVARRLGCVFGGHRVNRLLVFLTPSRIAQIANTITLVSQIKYCVYCNEV